MGRGSGTDVSRACLVDELEAEDDGIGDSRAGRSGWVGRWVSARGEVGFEVGMKVGMKVGVNVGVERRTRGKGSALDTNCEGQVAPTATYLTMNDQTIVIVLSVWAQTSGPSTTALTTYPTAIATSRAPSGGT
ncbi:hypothetical protein H6P81_016393 [Aristolochia fimbriata]|uniref:Uncharacterized protein n=1 Tax=Aristolochia fimbriata TaxID=158543 RepID=A0AAV7ECS7_ARIFI|nr:hypothetical protein H6P81_016393 [Aristolochia fimbriata]